MLDDELLAQIRAQPHDDHPRRIYADLLLARGDERGEYIQLALDATNNLWDDRKRARWDELKQREQAWAAELGLGGLESVSWYRGFPNSLTSTVERVLQHGGALSRLPIDSMTFWHSVGDLPSLAALPALATVDHLTLGGVAERGYVRSPGELHVPIPRDELQALCASPHLRAIRSLSFCDSLSDGGAETLGAARARAGAHALRGDAFKE